MKTRPAMLVAWCLLLAGCATNRTIGAIDNQVQYDTPDHYAALVWSALQPLGFHDDGLRDQGGGFNYSFAGTAEGGKQKMTVVLDYHTKLRIFVIDYEGACKSPFSLDVIYAIQDRFMARYHWPVTFRCGAAKRT